MDKVKEVKRQFKEAMESFQDVEKKKQLFLLETHKSIIDILIKYLSEDFRLSIQNYCELRNESLHTTLKNIDESLNLASEAHARMGNFRSQLIDACNDVIQPLIKTDDSHLLVKGQGVADLQNVTAETEQSVLQINDLQEKYCSLMAGIEDKIPQTIDATLSEIEAKNKITDQEKDREMEAILKAGEEELEKSVHILESMGKMKDEMENLFHILRKPNIGE